MVLVTSSCTVLWTSIHSSSGTLSIRSNPLNLFITFKGFDLGHTWIRSSGFPYFLQFKSEFGNKEFMIWATVSSRSCFCWLYKASPSLAAKKIINLISVLTIWQCSCVVFSCVVGRGYLLWPVCSLGKTLLAFALHYFVLQGQTCLLLQVSLDFLLLHSSPLWWKRHFFRCWF